MISEKYKSDLVQVRIGDPAWGGSAVRNAGPDVLRFLTRRKDVKSVLDFGSGLGTLGEYVAVQQKAGLLRDDIEWTNYDPGILGIDRLPTRTFDCVLSTDLLEHIEPDRLNVTLDWMRAHAARSQFHHIDCNDNKQLLPDGRSVHLIVQPPQWWRDQLGSAGWKIMRFNEIMDVKRGRERFSCLITLDRTIPMESTNG